MPDNETWHTVFTAKCHNLINCRQAWQLLSASTGVSRADNKVHRVRTASKLMSVVVVVVVVVVDRCHIPSLAFWLGLVVAAADDHVTA